MDESKQIACSDKITLNILTKKPCRAGYNKLLFQMKSKITNSDQILIFTFVITYHSRFSSYFCTLHLPKHPNDHSYFAKSFTHLVPAITNLVSIYTGVLL